MVLVTLVPLVVLVPVFAATTGNDTTLLVTSVVCVSVPLDVSTRRSTVEISFAAHSLNTFLKSMALFRPPIV